MEKGQAVDEVMALLRKIFEPRGAKVPPPLEVHDFFLLSCWTCIGRVGQSLFANCAFERDCYAGKATLLSISLRLEQYIWYMTRYSISFQVVCTRWGKDPLCYGSYSSVSTGSPGAEDYDRMAESEGSRVFFAGEATTRKYPATMHGAYISGLREAANISAALERLRREKQWENGVTEEEKWVDRAAGRTLSVDEKLQTGQMLNKVNLIRELDTPGYERLKVIYEVWQ